MRRRGLRLDPPDGWPLDKLLVGVATVRTIRDLLRLDREWSSEPVRAWDLSLRNGVSPTGSANSLERLRRLDLVRVVSPPRRRHAATFRLNRDHPLAVPLDRLFGAERAAYRVTRRERLEQRRLQREEIREHQEMLERRRGEMRKER